MSEHTPGPWVAFFVDGRASVIMPAGRPGDICLFRDGAAEADARLIAAAPELLEACKAILNVYFPTDTCGAREHWKRVEDAIAKAEGRP